MTTYYPDIKLWKGKTQGIIFNENLGIGQLILEVLKLTPERITQIFADNGSEMSCYEMRSRTIKIAHYLIQKGYKQHDIVGIMCANSENLAPVVFACLTLGMPINTLAPIMIESDIIQMYSKTKPKLIFCDANLAEMMKKSVDQMGSNAEIITLRDRYEGLKYVEDLFDNDFDIETFEYLDHNDIGNTNAFIICSSGSTGSPKAVCKSHKQLILHFSGRFFSISEGQNVTFTHSTIYWITGVIFLLMGTLYSKIRVITTSTYTPEVFLNIVKKFNVKSLFLPPACLAEFIASDINQNDKIMESVESFLCGGSHVSNLIYDSAQILFPNAHITIGYGTSEGDLCTDSIDEYRSGSVGKLFNNHAVIIDDNDQRLGPNQTGEICFTGKIPFCGYFEDDEKTREAIYEKVFFRSGDLGYFDEDGFLFISGRKKEMLKYNNYQISASELEELIETLEEIESSCVVGVLDENTGNDTIYAFVKKIPNMNIQENDILNFVNSKVIDAKQIRGGIHFVDSFPMTPSGKIKKVEMKKLAMKINTDKNHFIHNNLSNLNNVDKKVNASVLNENKIIFKI